MRNIESGGVTTGKPKGRRSDDVDGVEDDMDDKFEFILNVKLSS